MKKSSLVLWPCDTNLTFCWIHFCFRTFQATHNYNSISVQAKDFPPKTISTTNISPSCSFVDGFFEKKTPPIFHGFSIRNRCDSIAENVLVVDQIWPCTEAEDSGDSSGRTRVSDDCTMEPPPGTTVSLPERTLSKRIDELLTSLAPCVCQVINAQSQCWKNCNIL